jgi:nucleoid DNA-binding protein
MEHKLSSNISKRVFWRYVNVKIKHIIHNYHVFSIITILFEEILKDLKQGKEVKIFNFGILSLNDTKPRMYHDIHKRQVVLSKGRKILKFKLSRKVRKKMIENLDIDKTLKGD